MADNEHKKTSYFCYCTAVNRYFNFDTFSVSANKEKENEKIYISSVIYSKKIIIQWSKIKKMFFFCEYSQFHYFNQTICMYHIFYRFT